MTTVLSDRAIRYATARCAAGQRTSAVARQLGVSQRRIQQLCAESRRTGRPHVQQRPGRPPLEPSAAQTKLVLDAADGEHLGALRTARRIRANHNISYRTVYRVMKDNGMITPSAAKSRKRKWVRYQRRYSNAMWHVDWHAMREPRFRGMHLVAYLDDASRCVVAARVFRQATSENAVLALHDAIGQFGAPAAILSDNGLCFVGPHRKAPKSAWRPTAFEAALLDHGIELINSRPYHPQTNGKIERFFRSLEEEIVYRSSMSAYIDYYNEERLHWSLDIDNYETPLKAFYNKRAPDAIRKDNPGRAEEDADD